MSKPIAISILLPVYNAAATLRQCLDSILAQTWRNFEVIAVDDGSQDATPRILQAYAQRDQRIKPLRRRHRGIVSALNDGLAQCRGSFIARIDADDRMRPQRLARQLEFAQQHRHADLIGAQFNLFRDDGAITAAQQRYQDWSNRLIEDRQIKHNLFVESAIAHPTFFARKALYDRLGGYLHHPWAEDYDFLLRAWTHGAVFAKVAQILVEKRDSDQRLYRTDARCKRPAMLRAKAHYFSRGHWLDGKNLVIAGSGPSARTVAEALRQEGSEIECFLDHKDARPGTRRVAGIVCYYRFGDRARRLLSKRERNFFILCIGNRSGRDEQEKQFRDAGLKAGRHYLRFL